MYRALADLTYPIDQDEADRIAAARDAERPVPQEERRLVHLSAGELTPWLPSQSLPWLLEQGLIEKVEEGANDDKV